MGGVCDNANCVCVVTILGGAPGIGSWWGCLVPRGRAGRERTVTLLFIRRNWRRLENYLIASKRKENGRCFLRYDQPRNKNANSGSFRRTGTRRRRRSRHFCSLRDEKIEHFRRTIGDSAFRRRL